MVTPKLFAAESTNLQCEFQKAPLGIDVRHPRLNWAMGPSKTSNLRGQRQTAYRVLVASSLELLNLNKGDMWDSGKIASNKSIDVIYSGKPLKSGTRYCWKVQAWDKTSKPMAWSKPATWTMGFLDPGDWKAKWISHPSTSKVKVLSAIFETADGKISEDVTAKLNHLIA